MRWAPVDGLSDGRESGRCHLGPFALYTPRRGTLRMPSAITSQLVAPVVSTRLSEYI